MRLGRFEQALAEIEIQHTLEDPLSVSPHYGFVQVYSTSRQYDQAIEWCWKALELDSTAIGRYPDLGLAYLAKGQYDHALTFVQKYRSLVASPAPYYLGSMGHMYAVVGMREKALKLLDDLLASWRQGEKSSIAFGIASIHTGLGQREEALVWLERAYAMRALGLVYLKVDPTLDSLRSEPRFKAILKEMNFEVY
jgi:tetratricopeptide (TPR) repeat protein